MPSASPPQRDTVHSPALLERLDRFLDAVPRSDADVTEVGPFTLFSGRGPWTYYARPRVGGPQPVTRDDVADLARRYDQLGTRLSLEWVGERCPSLEPACRASGLAIETDVLMVAPVDRLRRPPAPSSGVQLRVVGPDDPDLVVAGGTADVGFGSGGTAPGPEGAGERDAAARDVPSATVEHLRQRARDWLSVTAVAASPDQGVLASGSYQPVGDMAEIVGVATLPVARRRGLATALTSFLAGHAAGHGVELLLLSAQSEDVARVYERVGFTRAGTSLAASPA